MNDSLSLDQFTDSIVLSSRLERYFTLMMLEIGDVWKIFHYQKCEVDNWCYKLKCLFVSLVIVNSNLVGLFLPNVVTFFSLTFIDLLKGFLSNILVSLWLSKVQMA